MRKDMRWGPDDPTVWPQECVDNLLHLPSIPRSPRSHKEAIMFWEPEPSVLMHRDNRQSIVRGKGQLDPNRSSQVSLCANALLEAAKTLESTYSEGRQPPLLRILRLYLGNALERLMGLHDDWDALLLAVREVQRAWAELAGFVSYVQVYQRRLDDPDAYHPIPDDCVGAFTLNAKQAQHLFRAGLPFWYMRELNNFQDEAIFKVVEPSRVADYLELEAHKSSSATACIFTWEARLEIHRAEFNTQPRAPSMSVSSNSRVGPSTGPSNVARPDRKKQRQERSSKPYSRTPGNDESEKPKERVDEFRDKFLRVNSPRMAPSIPAWELGLRTVDRSHSPQLQLAHLYAFPEPGLIVSSPDDARVNQMLYHLHRFYDALVFRMKTPSVKGTVPRVSGQQWRELLYGNTLKPQSSGKMTKSQKISASIAPVLNSAFAACGTDLTGLPMRKEDAPPMAIAQAQELTWLLAEMNFRYELVAFDAAISRDHNEGECMACFAGDVLNPPICESRRGLAATDLQERLPHLLGFATIMKKWAVRRPCPTLIARAHEATTWRLNEIEELETQVARHYTQCFYDHSGRAAVVPLRL
ncbi:hypothetical protein GGX14DRAFT_618498, partial [Mycena pura]